MFFPFVGRLISLIMIAPDIRYYGYILCGHNESFGLKAWLYAENKKIQNEDEENKTLEFTRIHSQVTSGLNCQCSVTELWQLGTHQRRYNRITWSSPLSIQIAIVKLPIWYSAVKWAICFDILRNESASTDKLSKHQSPCSAAPHLVSVLGLSLLTFVLEFELCTLRASTGPVLVQTSKENEVECL